MNYIGKKFICVKLGNGGRGTNTMNGRVYGIGHVIIINKEPLDYVSGCLEGTIGASIAYVTLRFLEDCYLQLPLTKLEYLIYGIDPV